MDDEGDLNFDTAAHVARIEKRFDSLTGIDRTGFFPNGIVTLVVDRDMIVYERPMFLVAWKIDDMAWRVGTANRSHIVENDPEARKDVFSFTPDSHGWSWGVAPYGEMAPALRLVQRIKRLTAEWGLEIEHFEYEVIDPDE